MDLFVQIFIPCANKGSSHAWRRKFWFIFFPVWTKHNTAFLQTSTRFCCISSSYFIFDVAGFILLLQSRESLNNSLGHYRFRRSSENAFAAAGLIVYFLKEFKSDYVLLMIQASLDWLLRHPFFIFCWRWSINLVTKPLFLLVTVSFFRSAIVGGSSTGLGDAFFMQSL